MAVKIRAWGRPDPALGPGSSWRWRLRRRCWWSIGLGAEGQNVSLLSCRAGWRYVYRACIGMALPCLDWVRVGELDGDVGVDDDDDVSFSTSIFSIAHA